MVVRVETIKHGLHDGVGVRTVGMGRNRRGWRGSWLRELRLAEYFSQFTSGEFGGQGGFHFPADLLQQLSGLVEAERGDGGVQHQRDRMPRASLHGGPEPVGTTHALQAMSVAGNRGHGTPVVALTGGTIPRELAAGLECVPRQRAQHGGGREIVECVRLMPEHVEEEAGEFFKALAQAVVQMRAQQGADVGGQQAGSGTRFSRRKIGHRGRGSRCRRTRR